MSSSRPEYSRVHWLVRIIDLILRFVCGDIFHFVEVHHIQLERAKNQQ